MNTFSHAPQAEPINHPNISVTSFPNLHIDLHPHLTKLPDEEEIRNTLSTLSPLKTLKEDGVQAIFYQRNWILLNIQSLPLYKIYSQQVLYLNLGGILRYV